MVPEITPAYIVIFAKSDKKNMMTFLTIAQDKKSAIKIYN
jgi:hypothetical protein